MPYFYNNDVNVLFIHIPKTGGTSLEKYFSKKFNIELNKESLFTTNPKDFLNDISYQHQLLKTIKTNKRLFRIDNEKLQIISIVRNPYFRIVSDLFFKNLIKESFNKEDVYNVIKNYILDSKNVKHDNHRIPQYLFLVDDDNNLFENITILKTETLNDDMIFNGYTDFNNYEQVSNVRNKNYYSYLNINSINLINEFYNKDFELFGYEKFVTTNIIDLHYKTLMIEIDTSNKYINTYLLNYLDSVNENKTTNIENNETNDLMTQYKKVSQYNNINTTLDKYYEEYKKKIHETFNEINK
jgi:hypothetical protein